MKQLRERYTGTEAERYEQLRQGVQWDREDAALAEALDRLAPRTVLDVPCGTGRFWRHYAERGVRATGIDLSADMLRQAKQRGWDDVHRADVFCLPAMPRADLAVCFRFLNWMDRETAVEVLRVLRGLSRAQLVSVGLGKGVRGRTPQHDPVIFARAGLVVIHDVEIVHGSGWTYRVIETRGEACRTKAGAR